MLHLPGFILVVSSSDTMLVVSTLDIVQDCHTAVSSVLKGLIIVPVGNMGPFLLEDKLFKTAKGLVDYV